MLWLRIIHLKQNNSQPLTEQEQDILTLVQTTSFSVPEPIFLQIRQIGNLVTKTGQHLYPEFPELPNQEINGQLGYYGPIQLPAPDADLNIHNLYEEIPCLGVLAEAVRQSISDAAPGPYVSSLDVNQDNRVNQNLLGYKPLGIRRAKAKKLAFASSITHIAFLCYPETTGLNFEFLNSISSILSLTKTFKISEVVFSTLSETDAQSQIVISRSVTQLARINILGETRTTSLTQEDTAQYGSAVFFDSQLMKEPAEVHRLIGQG